MANGNQIKFGVGYEVDKASVQRVKKSLQDLQNVKFGDFSGTREELRQIQGVANQVQQALTKAFNVKLNSLNTNAFNKQLQSMGLNVNKIYQSFSKMGVQGQIAFSSMASSVLTTNLHLKETSNLISKMGQTMANTAKWGIASSIMNSFTNSVQQAFQYVKSLDSALTDIRIVTGDSTEKMREFAVQANQVAQSLGRSTMDYSKAALTFYQQGLSEQDVQARTQSTLVAQNITGAGQEMADYLTAVWNGYKVANEEAELYVDKLAAVADSSASNMSQLAVAMSKVASTANMLGVPVDSLNAQIATIVATTRQAPESVGNALKTIYARINDISTGADDAQMSLGNYSSKMAEVGISVLDANGRLRDTGDVIDEVGQKWATLSREQQIYLARTMAGQRQYNNLLALFENWGRYTDLVNISMDAQGAAMEKNERYMDSLAAKMEQFGAAGERVKASLINEEDLKGIVDFGTGAVNLFGSLIDGIGGGRNAILALGSIFTSVFSGTIAKELNSFITNIQNAKVNTELLKNDIQNLQTFKAFGENNDAIKKLTTHIGELQKYYSVLDQVTINNQKNLIGELDVLENNKMQLEANKEAIIEYANQIQGINTADIWEKDSEAVLNLNSALDNLQGSSANVRDLFTSLVRDETSLDRFTQHFNEFYEAYNQLNPEKAQALFNAFNNGAGAFSGNFRQLLTQALNQADNKARLYSQTIDNAAQKQQQLNNKTQQLESIISQNEKGFKQLFDINNVIKFASGIGQIASSINTIINLTKTWKDENISLGEKLTRTFTTIGFLIPMIVSAYKNITQSLGIQEVFQAKHLKAKAEELLLEKQITAQRAKRTLNDFESASALFGDENVDEVAWEKAKKTYEEAQQAAKKAEKNVSDAAKNIQGTTKSIGSSITGLFSKLFGFLSGPGGIIVAIGTLATIIGVSLYKAWNSAKEAAQQATKQMQAANDIYKESKDKLDDLKSSLESLKDAQDNLNQLTTGTEEWKSALEDVNNQVIELLEKFPELAKYVSTSSNGMLQISEEGQQYIIDQQRQTVQANAIGYLSGRQRSDAANRQSEITQASRNWGMGAWDSSVLDKVVTAVQEEGSRILENTSELKNLTGANDKQIDAINKHKSEIITLAEKLTANTTATDSLTQSIITGTFIDSDKIASSSNSDIFTAQASKAIANATLDYSKYGIDPNKTYRNASADEWQTAYRKASQSGQSISDFVAASDQIIIDEQAKKKIIERYKEINSDIADQISISGGKIIRTAKDTKEKTQLNFEDVMQAVATADATTSEGMKQIYKHAEQVAQEMIRKFGDDATNIYKLGAGTLAAGQISIEDLLSFRNNEDIIKTLMDQTGKTKNQILQIIADLALQTSKGITEYITSLPEGIKADLKILSDRDQDNRWDISESIMKSIGASLQNAWKNGTYNQYLDLLKNVKPEDMAGVTEFIDSLGEDINSIDTNTFIQKLADLGYELDESAQEKVPELIAALKELNGINLQEGLGQLYDGATSFLEKYAKDANATLTKNEFESLSGIAAGLDMDLSQFFDQTWKGSYKLKTTAQEFFDYINNQSLEGFKNAVSDAQAKLSQLQTANAIKEGIGSSVTVEGLQARNENRDNKSLAASANFLQGLGETDQSIQNVLNAIQKGLEVQKEDLNKVNELLIQHKNEWDNISEEVIKAGQHLSDIKEQQSEITAEQEQMRQQFREMQLDDEVDADKWKNLAEYINQYGTEINKAGKASERISKDAEESVQIAEDLAQEILRYASALQEVTDNYDTWKKQLQSGSAEEAAQAANELADVYADLLNLPFEQGLTPNFTNDITNLELLKQATEGSEQAYNQLLEKAGQDIIFHAGFEADQFYSDKATIENEIKSFTGQDFGNIEIGAALNDEAFLQSLSDIVNNAHMTAQQATNYLASMGIDAEVKEEDNTAEETQEIAGYHAVPTVVPIHVNRVRKTEDGRNVTDHLVETFSSVRYEPDYVTVKGKKENKSFALKVTSAHKSSGGNFKYNQTSHKTPSGNSGGGGGGGGGSAKQPTVAKTSTTKIDTKEKQQFANPYQQVQRSYNRQEDSLKTLNDLQKKLTGKDRLTNLKQQNKELEKQNKIISKRQDISNDSSKVGTTAYYKNQIQTDKALRNVAKFDNDGTLINQTATKNAAVNAYNQQLNAYKQDFEKTQKDYNNWIENVWNKYSGEEQQAHKQEKEARDQDLKDFESTTKEKIKLADEEYNEKIKLIENYQKALQEDQKFHQQLLQNLEKIIENTIAKKKIKVDLALDFGQTEREFMDFENKFIKKIKKDDIFANAKASFRELQSYVTSGELNQLANKMKNLQGDIASISNGAFNSRFGIDRTTWDKLTEKQRENLRKGTLNTLKEELEDYSKKYMDSLEKIQDLQEEIREAYLDSIDDAKDKMDDVIDQYERINDLVEHNIKLTQLLYGDNAGFDTLDKYYAKQERNNLNQLKQLRQYQAYWKGQLNSAVFGTEEWKRFKENLENVTDEINSVLENQLELITTKFENQVQKALQNVQNKLTKGLGVDYLDQEWDHITQDDDAFLDAVNTRFGIDEVERLYQDAAAGVAGNIPQQQRINKLMNDQLKLLREKDRLTQYDIDRAKAALEVEKARMELEDSRYNKTKMRLRRDSQGNYTYQYVADEEKLSDLESALADAQANLYNMDKEHYQQQLEEMNSAYRKYLEDYAELTKQYEATQDKAEKARLEARMKQLKERFSNYVDSINEDANFTLRIYLPGSTGDALGVDTSAMTGEQTLEFLKNTVPGVNSAYTELSQTLLEQGGVVQASTQYFKDLADAVKEAAAQKQVLNAAGTSVSKITSGKDSTDINQVEKYLEPYKNVANTAVQTIDQMEKLNDIVDKFCNKNIKINQVAESLENVYTVLQDINTLSNRSITTVFDTDDQELASIIGTTKKDAKAIAKKNNLTSAEKSSLQSLFYKSIADAYETENQAMELAQYINSFYDSGKKMSNKQKAALLKQMQNYQSEIVANADKAQRISTALNQKVDISATFPNVTDRNEIVEAINILNGKAAQKASQKKA